MFHILYPQCINTILNRDLKSEHVILIYLFGGYYLVCMVDLFGRLYVSFSQVTKLK
jgi:hypothetical protein